MGRLITSVLAAVCCIAVLYEQLNMDLIPGVNGMLQRDHAETKGHYVARGDARPGAHGPSGLFHGPRGPAGPPGSRGVNGNNNSGAPGPLGSDGSIYGPSGEHGQRGESE